MIDHNVVFWLGIALLLAAPVVVFFSGISALLCCVIGVILLAVSE